MTRLQRPLAAALSLWLCLGAAPLVFAPGVVSGPSNDGSPSFSPDGKTTYFTRTGVPWSVIMESHREGERWSAPQIAPFSGRWSDGYPSVSADGTYIVYVSQRPGVNGKGSVANLWRVDRAGASWGEPVRLPATVNIGPAVWRPSVAADGSIYFIAFLDGAPRLYVSAFRNGAYLPAQPIALSTAATRDVDPEIAPDQSFMIFASSGRADPSDTREHLYVTFKTAMGWGPVARVHYAGDDRPPSTDNEPRLSRDGHTLYFTSDRSVLAHFPRTLAQARLDVARMDAWDNSNTNVWALPISSRALAAIPPLATPTTPATTATAATAAPPTSATTLNATLADLTYFLGSWQCSGSFPSSGKAIASTMRFESDLAGNAVVKHQDDVPPNSYHAIETWNFAAGNKRFDDSIVDNYGGARLFSTDGWHDSVLTWSIAAGVRPVQQFVYTRLSATTMRVDWQVSKDAAHYAIGDTLTCTKS